MNTLPFRVAAYNANLEPILVIPDRFSVAAAPAPKSARSWSVLRPPPP